MGTSSIMGSAEIKPTVGMATDFARKAAAKIPVFEETGNGAIVFMAVPFSKQMDDWLGGLSECDENGVLIDKHEYVAVRTIRPGGSHTIQWTDPEDGHTEPVNCMTYAMAKIAYLSRLVKESIPYRGVDEQRGEFLEANGYSSHKGAACISIYYRGALVLCLYVVFSGATEDEDQQCADETVKALTKHLDKTLGDEYFFFSQTVEGYI